MAAVDSHEAERLERRALGAYFTAWKAATSLAIPSAAGAIELGVAEMDHSAKNGLQSVYSLVRASQELALKSILYNAASSADESATIDSLLLLAIRSDDCRITEALVKTIAQTQHGVNLSQYIDTYEEMLGLLDPIGILMRQYMQFYPNRSWLKDFLAAEVGVSTPGSQDNNKEYKYQVIRQLSLLYFLSSEKLAKKLLGMKELSQLYKCDNCLVDLDHKKWGASPKSIERERGTLSGKCRLCDKEYILRRKKCLQCGCDVIDNATLRCFACGDMQ